MKINKVIDHLEQGEAVYYVQTADFCYENGRKMAGTWAEYIRLNLEHGPYDIAGVHAFMKGLTEAGPTSSGHRMPTVIAELPFQGTSEAVVEANRWIIAQLLATGLHGFLLCHAENPDAVRAVVESMRYSFQSLGVGRIIKEGRRGHGGQKSAARVWGVTPTEYLQKADVWPLNPDGELLLGLKIENRRALSQVELSVAVPGVSFVEWGPGDMGMDMGYPEQHEPPYPEEMLEARARVFDACEKSERYFLNAAYDFDELRQLIDEGVMFFRIPDEDSEGELAAKGREYKKRQAGW